MVSWSFTWCECAVIIINPKHEVNPNTGCHMEKWQWIYFICSKIIMGRNKNNNNTKIITNGTMGVYTKMEISCKESDTKTECLQHILKTFFKLKKKSFKLYNNPSLNLNTCYWTLFLTFNSNICIGCHINCQFINKEASRPTTLLWPHLQINMLKTVNRSEICPFKASALKWAQARRSGKTTPTRSFCLPQGGTGGSVEPAQRPAWDSGSWGRPLRWWREWQMPSRHTGHFQTHTCGWNTTRIVLECLRTRMASSIQDVCVFLCVYIYTIAFKFGY